jgi:PAS domain S-box-containing protein
MPHSSVATPDRRSAVIVLIVAAYSILVGATALAGWALNVRRLTDWTNRGISMFPNTALCAVLAGVGLILLARRGPAWAMTGVRFAAAGLTVISGITLLEHATGVNFGIDELLFKENTRWVSGASSSPMRMGLPASASFTILGVALLLATRGPQGRRAATVLPIFTAGIAALSLTGYWFGADQLFGIARYSGIALETSTVIAAASIALIVAIPDHGLAALMRRDDAGGAVVRRLIVPILVVPLLLGWLRIVGQHANLYDLEFGTALRTLIETALLFALLWWTANSISHHAKSAGKAEAHLAAIVESSDDAVISKSLQGIITTWNPGAERMFGYSEEEAVGQPILMLIPPDRAHEEAMILSKLTRGERIEHYETVRLRKDGQPVDISVTISPMYNAAGTIIGASKIARDVGDQKRLRQRLVEVAEEREHLLTAERAARTEAERANLMKDEFLATLSHELRTPLNAIYGWAQVLGLAPPNAETLSEGIDAIERNARAQTQLIDDLLDMSRIISGKIRLDVQRVDVAPMIEAAFESVRPSAEAKGVVLRKILDPLAGPVSGDPTRLQQIVWNLLSNAIKFTPKGGKVDVLLERVNSHLEITVHDSGIGIKPEFLAHVFERFRQADATITRSHGGLGLGLSIVKSLAELHGGTVRAKSGGEGQGSTFVVLLPLAPVRGAEVREHPTTAKANDVHHHNFDLGGVKVLVVDDEQDARKLIDRVLTGCAAEVFSAASAGEGLKLLQTHKPHVLISDIGMPEVDGFQFIRQVRALPSEAGGRTPAIALTAFARSEDRTRAMIAGYQVHIAKPIETQELLATVGSLAGRAAVQ